MNDTVFVLAFSMCNMMAFSAQASFWTSAAGAPLHWLDTFASSAACMALYIFDRMIPSSGDDPESAFRKRARNGPALVTLVTASAFVVVSGLFHRHLLRNTMIALPFGLVYCAQSTPIKTLFPCSKNVYVSLMWLCWFFGAADAFPPPDSAHSNVYVAYFCHMMLSNAIMDVKDVRGDRENGIRTLPVMVGERMARPALLTCTVALAFAGARIDTALPITYAAFAMVLAIVKLDDGFHASLCSLALMVMPWCVSKLLNAVVYDQMTQLWW